MSVRAIHHLDCGTMCPLAGKLVGGDAWLRPGLLVCHVLAIETDRDGIILVDTGYGTRECAEPSRLPRLFRALARPRLDPAQTALAQLARRGFRADDVRHVIVTHLDPDHAGGLPDFPGATVHVHRPEYLAASRRDTLAEKTRYLAAQWQHGPRWATYLPEGDTWMGLPAVRRLDGVDADVAIVPLVGHTRGHAGVAVRVPARGSRWLLHAGDAIFHRAELDGEAPVPPGLRAIAALDEHDRAARRASVAALRGLAARPDVAIVCSHDPMMLQAMT